jgi:nonsense-mediated mRNA decay protein 3
MKIDPLVRLVVCKRCGAVKVPGGWKTIQSSPEDEETTREEHVSIVLDREIEALGEELEVTIVETNKLDRVLHINLIARGKSHPDLPPHTEEYPVEIRFDYGTCDTCGMMSGGYHEAIIQIRADERPVSESEQEDIADIATELTISEYGRDERAFIIEIDDTKFGLDFYIGSEHLARRIADEIEVRYLAERKENYKLIGQEKDGREKFRITILLRLPRFSIDDFIEVSGHLCQILDMGRGGLACYDLVTREQFTINPKSSRWQSIQFIAPNSATKEFMVVANAYDQPIQLMDQQSYEVFEVESDFLQSEYIEAGNIIEGIEYGGDIHILPSSTDETIDQ